MELAQKQKDRSVLFRLLAAAAATATTKTTTIIQSLTDELCQCFTKIKEGVFIVFLKT